MVMSAFAKTLSFHSLPTLSVVLKVKSGSKSAPVSKVVFGADACGNVSVSVVSVSVVSVSTTASPPSLLESSTVSRSSSLCLPDELSDLLHEAMPNNIDAHKTVANIFLKTFMIILQS